MTQMQVLSRDKDIVEIVSNTRRTMEFQFTEISKSTKYLIGKILRNMLPCVNLSNSQSNWPGLLLDIKSKASPSKGQIK